MSLEGIMPKEREWLHKDKGVWSHLGGTKPSQRDAESRMVGTGEGTGRKWELWFNGHRLSHFHNEEILETVLHNKWVRIAPLNCTYKNNKDTHTRLFCVSTPGQLASNSPSSTSASHPLERQVWLVLHCFASRNCAQTPQGNIQKWMLTGMLTAVLL